MIFPSNLSSVTTLALQMTQITSHLVSLLLLAVFLPQIARISLPYKTQLKRLPMPILVGLRVKYMVVVEKLGGKDSITRLLQLVLEVIWVLVLVLARLRVEYMIEAGEWGGEDSITRVLQVEHQVIWVLVLVLVRVRVENMIVTEEKGVEDSMTSVQQLVQVADEEVIWVQIMILVRPRVEYMVVAGE